VITTRSDFHYVVETGYRSRLGTIIVAAVTELAALVLTPATQRSRLEQRTRMFETSRDANRVRDPDDLGAATCAETQLAFAVCSAATHGAVIE
jgi:hypothetical protein